MTWATRIAIAIVVPGATDTIFAMAKRPVRLVPYAAALAALWQAIGTVTTGESLTS